MAAYLTPDQIAAVERDIMIRRGERSRAAERAKVEAAAEGSQRADQSPEGFMRTGINWVVGNQPKFNAQQVQELIAGYRAQYARYDNPEIVELMEAKLAAALKADGIEVPPLSAEDRL